MLYIGYLIILDGRSIKKNQFRKFPFFCGPGREGHGRTGRSSDLRSTMLVRQSDTPFKTPACRCAQHMSLRRAALRVGLRDKGGVGGGQTKFVCVKWASRCGLLIERVRLKSSARARRAHCNYLGV